MEEFLISSEYQLTNVGERSRLFRTLDIRFETREEDILLDFSDLNVEKPWKNQYFPDLMRNEHIYIRLRGDKDTGKYIEGVLRISGCKNVKRYEVLYETREHIDYAKLEREKNMCAWFDNCFTLDGTTMSVACKNAKVTQIGSKDTAYSLMNSAINKCTGNKVTDLIFDFSGLTIMDGIHRFLAERSNDKFFIENDINVSFIDNNDTEKINTIELHRTLKNNGSLPSSSRLELLKTCGLVEGTVVILQVFKKTRGVNDFNQMNDGKAIMSRVAIFNGYKNRFNRDCGLSFTTFKKKTFTTERSHFLLTDIEDEDDLLKRLETQNLEFDIMDIGFEDRFTGKCGHINYPVQWDKSNNLELAREVDGKVIMESLSLPRYIKEVLDSWDIPYNKQNLDYCISLTDKNLS